MTNSSNTREIITIGIELNHVVRNINKQIIKYYIKEFNLNVDMEDIDDKEDIFKDFAKFESKYAKNNFLYIDYPYEVFGCAHTMEKKLSVKITNWLSDIENIEDKDIRIVFYSLDEEALTIQSTYFFLSKIGTRVRTMMFPKSINEVYDKCDVIITARNEFFEKEIPLGKKIVLVNRPFNTEYKVKAFLNYDNLSDIISDNDFFNKIENGKKE